MTKKIIDFIHAYNKKQYELNREELDELKEWVFLITYGKIKVSTIQFTKDKIYEFDELLICKELTDALNYVMDKYTDDEINNMDSSWNLISDIAVKNILEYYKKKK
jgi:hypothetical protein